MSEPLKLQPGDRLWMGERNQGTVIEVSPDGDHLDYGSKGRVALLNLKDND